MKALRIVVPAAGGVGASTLAGALAGLDGAAVVYEHRAPQDAAVAAGLSSDVATLENVLDRLCMTDQPGYVVLDRYALTQNLDETRSFVADAMRLGIATSAIVVVSADYLVNRAEIPTLESLGVHLTMAVTSDAPPAAIAAFKRLAGQRTGYSVIHVPRLSRASFREWRTSGDSLAHYMQAGRRISARAAVASWLDSIDEHLRVDLRGV